jgi:1-aminocyclopropane-1-carboxylate deaminase
MNSVFNTSRLQAVSAWPDLEVKILRDDLIHPFVSGNKWRKLKYNIAAFEKSGCRSVVTFGGAYSNHLVATAAASKIFKFDVTGIVRGETVRNSCTDFMTECGMKLHFISRSDYRRKDDPSFINGLLKKINPSFHAGDFFIIPEGGANENAVRGAAEISADAGEFDFIICPCGTGTTLAGLARSLKAGQKAIGISVLKAEGYIENQVLAFNGNLENVVVINDYHFGGYAKTNDILSQFCRDFMQSTGIRTEPVYTGKMFYAFNDLVRKKYFPPGSRITLVHTGGTSFTEYPTAIG